MSDQKPETSGWQLEGSAAEAYERYFVPTIFASWAERLIDRADIREGDRVLDVACGTGIVARRIASRRSDGGSVVGLDVNEGMLEVAKATADAEGLTIEWRLGDATELPFPDERFDVVCCQQALQFIDDASAALSEMHRVLTPGGRAVLSVWRPLGYNPGYAVLADVLERHLGEEAGEMMRSPFPEWDADDLRDLAIGAGFDDQTVRIEIGSVRYPSAAEFVRREVASSPLASDLADGAVRDSLVRDVERELRAYTDDEGVVSPMESYVHTIRR